MNEPPPSLINLPSEIITNILSRLPPRTIVSCRCVCSRWHEVLSSPQFAKLHLSTSTPNLLVSQIDRKGEYHCQVVEHEDVFQLRCHNLGYKVVIKFVPKAFIRSPADYRVKVVGSVNGLLCLKYSSKIDDVIYICNPITRECTFLPKLARINEYANFTHYGLGLSSSTGQYKVVYLFQKSEMRVWQCLRSKNYKCEFYEYLIYTLGTGSWRSIPRNSPFEHAHLSFGVFLNGNLHGLVKESSESAVSISCFDLEDESFKPFPPPPYPLKIAWFASCDVIGVLDGCLCISDSSSLGNDGTIGFWTMKDYGVAESWTRQFVFVGTEIHSSIFDVPHPIRGYKNGDILFSWGHRKVFHYSSKAKTSQEVYLFDENIDSNGSFETIMLHNSSFVSLESFYEENVTSFADLLKR